MVSTIVKWVQVHIPDFLVKKKKRIDSVLATGPKPHKSLNKEKALILKQDDDTWPVNEKHLL